MAVPAPAPHVAYKSRYQPAPDSPRLVHFCLLTPRLASPLYEFRIKVHPTRHKANRNSAGRAYAAIPTTFMCRAFPPNDPKNDALPNPNTPPSAATIQ